MSKRVEDIFEETDAQADWDIQSQAALMVEFINKHGDMNVFERLVKEKAKSYQENLE